MRFGLRGYAVGASMGLAGCALIAGLDDEKGATDPADADVPDRGRGIISEDAPTFVDGAPCKPKVLSEKTPPPIRRVVEPVSIDGTGSEWGCVDSFDFVQGDRRVDLTAGRAVAKVALQWEPEAVYLFATVTTLTPVGAADPNGNFKNDSFHWFAMGPTVGPEYTAQDHHVTVDALSQTTDFSDVAGIRPTLDGIAGKASPLRPGDNGLTTFDVEIRMTAKTLGRTSLAAGDKIRMNFQINDGPPIGTAIGPPYRILFVNAASCPVVTNCNINGTSEPYCNPACTMPMTLE